MRARARINIPDRGYTTAPMSEFPYVGNGDDFDELGDMTSLRKNKTGVDNTILISTKGYGQPGPADQGRDQPAACFHPWGEDSVNGASR
jgi:hypothetical protein